MQHAIALACLLLAGQVARAAEFHRLGIFPVLGATDAVGETKIIGTAFLCDASEGLLLTAAHVIRDAPNPDSSIIVRLGIPLLQDGSFEVAEQVVSTKMVASNYSFVSRPQIEDQADWALLQIEKAEHRELLDIFEPIHIKHDQTEASISDLTTDSGVQLLIAGYPKTQVVRNVELTQGPQSNGIWRASGSVAGGFSGGPCFYFDEQKRRFYLVGLVLEEQLVDTCLILPSSKFVKPLSDKLVPSERLLQLLDYLRQPDTAGAATPESRIRVYRNILKLNGFEHWQLRKQLCEDASIGDNRLAIFVIRFYSTAAHPGFTRDLLLCRSRPAFTAAIVSEANAITRVYRANPANVPAHISMAAREVHQVALTDYYEAYIVQGNRVEDQLRKPLAEAMAEYVLYTRTTGRSPASDNNATHPSVVAALTLGAKLDPAAMAPAYAVADRELSGPQKLALTANEVNLSQIPKNDGGVTLKASAKDADIFWLWESEGELSQATNGGTHDDDEPEVSIDLNAEEAQEFQATLQNRDAIIQERLPALRFRQLTPGTLEYDGPDSNFQYAE